MSKISGALFTISAPSGAGKTSLVKALAEADSRIKVSISHTTRLPRPGEMEGDNYHFIDDDVFDKMSRDGDFLESAEVFGHPHGTSADWVSNQLEAGFDVALEIDWQGASQVKLRLPSACSIFILPPSRAALRERLTGRRQDDQSVIEQRMAEAGDELSHYRTSDYLVLNEDFGDALSELKTIFECHRLLTARRSENLCETLNELMK